jgi:hypothetical protein
LEAQLARLKQEHGTAPPGSRPASPGSQAVPLGPATPPEPRKPPA